MKDSPRKLITTQDLIDHGACGHGMDLWYEVCPDGEAEYERVVDWLNERSYDGFSSWIVEEFGDTETFTFDQLCEKAKEAVRILWSEDVNYEFCYEDFVSVGEILGICIKTRDTRRRGTCIYWSGFYHQGSGLAYDAHYSYAKGALRRIRHEYPKDTELIRIAEDLQTAQRPHFYHLTADVESVRDTSIRVSVDHSEDMYRDLGDAEGQIEEALENFASWMYDKLQDAYEWETSDEAISESCVSNGYLFNLKGKMV